MVTAEQRVVDLGLTLPQVPVALGSYKPVHVVGDMLYTSGVLPMWNGELRVKGIVGDGLSVAEGVAAARLCALNILALIREHAGTLDAVEHMVQIVGFVRSGEGFVQQPRVLNGASDLLYEVLGERGRHTRLALGTTELPLGAAVEISAVVRLEPQRVVVGVG